MTITEVCAELRKEPKIYIGIMKQSSFSGTLFSIENNRAKPSTIKSFFNKFGYDGEFNEWYKKVNLSENLRALKILQGELEDSYQKIKEKQNESNPIALRESR